MLIYIGDMYSLLCFHYFIVSCFKPSIGISNHSLTDNKYIHKDLHNSNMRHQCPEMEIELVDVAMCKEPHTNEDAPAGSSLRLSSQEGRP